LPRLRPPLVRWAILGVIVSFYARSTTIIGAQTESAIILGADSLIVDAGALDAQVGTKRYECKIASAMNVVWAVQGLRGADFPSGRRFNVDEIASQAIKGGGNLEARIDAFKNLVLPPLYYTLRGIRQAQPENFKAMDGKAILEIVFAAFDGGRTVLTKRSFEVRISGPDFTIEPVKNDGRPGQILTAGYIEALQAWFKKPPPNWKPTADWLFQIISREEKINSNVGGEISIVTIDKTGSHWNRRGACSQKNNSPEVPSQWR
jgi:hypothetical protein